MLHTLERIASYYPDLAFPVEKKAGSRYFYENTAFSYADAITFFGMLREYQPKRLIEAGSGFSSCVAMDTNDKFFGGDIETTFVDPYPETLEGLLDVDDPYRARIRRMALQDAPIEWFEALQAGDVLFLDSSHVAKTGSDVNDYFFRILPKLQSGVVIHIHDILFPYEYPAAWVLDENRSWNEIYMLRTFLQYNQAFEVIFLNDFMYRKYARMAQLRMPLCLKQPGGSIWIRKR